MAPAHVFRERKRERGQTLIEWLGQCWKFGWPLNLKGTRLSFEYIFLSLLVAKTLSICTV
ncbi:hypothetical protein NC652_015736 [Populus alba x Populus x berolinensis]|nr:hypothetical protein NC652_015736 [Populus alba x Populus x berolinensis]